MHDYRDYLVEIASPPWPCTGRTVRAKRLPKGTRWYDYLDELSPDCVRHEEVYTFSKQRAIELVMRGERQSATIIRGW